MLNFWRLFEKSLRKEAQALVDKSDTLILSQSDENGVSGWCVVPSADQSFWLGQWPTAKAAFQAVKPLNKVVREAK